METQSHIGEAGHHALDRQPAKDPAKANKPDPTQKDAPIPGQVHSQSAAASRKPSDPQPDALRPGSANDPRNHSRFEPLHSPGGSAESPHAGENDSVDH